jgi:hypothetical protein
MVWESQLEREVVVVSNRIVLLVSSRFPVSAVIMTPGDADRALHRERFLFS